MIEDKEFCMSSYLMYRYVYDNNFCFKDGLECNQIDIDFERKPVVDKDTLRHAVYDNVKEAVDSGSAALALSGGMDSAILAAMVPEGTKAYTFRCIVPGKKVIDESEQAQKWARYNHLDHEIIDITWDELRKAADICMLHKHAPVHSIEAQIYIAAKQARANGIKRMIFGENADIIYGGMNGLISKDWTYGEFVDRYCYVMPYRVLREPVMVMGPFLQMENDGYIDGYEFTNVYFRQEALGTYINACQAAGIEFVGPYSRTRLDVPIDYNRIRSGDTKYLIGELFHEIYPEERIPEKIPMPRPMEQWMKDWEGPKRKEFIPGCAEGLSGDQKWMLWSLERYLELTERV